MLNTARKLDPGEHIVLISFKEKPKGSYSSLISLTLNINSNVIADLKNVTFNNYQNFQQALSTSNFS